MFGSSLLHKSDINSQGRALPSAIMDDVPGMKAVWSLLMFPNYKPFGTGRGKSRAGGWRAVMGLNPSRGRRTGRGSESMEMETSSTFTKALRLAQGRMLSLAQPDGNALAPHTSPVGHRCSQCDSSGFPPAFYSINSGVKSMDPPRSHKGQLEQWNLPLKVGWRSSPARPSPSAYPSKFLRKRKKKKAN